MERSKQQDSSDSPKAAVSPAAQRSSSQNVENNNSSRRGGGTRHDTENNNLVAMDTEEDGWGSELVTALTSTSPEEQRATRYLEAEGYSSFLYWREPVPDLVDIDLREQQEELQVVRTELSNLDMESTSDDASETETETVVEKTEAPAEKTETERVHVEELEKEDLPEKDILIEELDNIHKSSTTENENRLDNKEEEVNSTEKLDGNENDRTENKENSPEEKPADEKGEHLTK